MDSGANPERFKLELHGPFCLGCGRPGRVKERRATMQVRPDGHGGAVRYLQLRVRRECWTPGCRCWHRSWTDYEPGDYPRRKYRLELALAVVEALGVFGSTLSGVARRFGLNRRTVGRLIGWTKGIDTVEAAAIKCAQVDPTVLPPAEPPAPDPPRPSRPSAALEKLFQARHLVLLLEHLASLLRGHGVALEQGPGLVVLLRNQFNRWGEVFFVTDRSPPSLRIPWPPGSPAS